MKAQRSSVYMQSEHQLRQPTSWVMLATCAMLYSVSSVDSFSIMKLEATIARCHSGFIWGSMRPWLSVI